MPTIDELYPSRFLKAEADLRDPVSRKWKEYTLEIESLDLEEVGANQEIQPVLRFKGAKKGVVMNKTQMEQVAEAVGSRNTDEWKGQLVTLYRDSRSFQGKPFNVISFKEPTTATVAQNGN